MHLVPKDTTLRYFRSYEILQDLKIIFIFRIDLNILIIIILFTICILSNPALDL